MLVFVGLKQFFSDGVSTSGLFKELPGEAETDTLFWARWIFQQERDQCLPGFDKVACNFPLSPEGGTCGHWDICLKD